MLVVVFAIGLVIRSLEHFFIPGRNNVSDAGGVAFLFRFSVALLVTLEITGLIFEGSKQALGTLTLGKKLSADHSKG